MMATRFPSLVHAIVWHLPHYLRALGDKGIELPPPPPQGSWMEFPIHRKQLPLLLLVQRSPKDYTLHHSLTGEWLGEEERSNRNGLIYFGTFSCGVRRAQKILSLSLWDCVITYSAINLVNTSWTQGLLPSELESEVSQSCPTLCNPMDCSLPGSSIHGIFQARILEWVAVSFSRGIFSTQGLNLGLIHCRQTLPSEPPGKTYQSLN